MAFVTVPADHARHLTLALVENRLAACVNSIASVHSTYRWDGKIDEADETLLLIKTTTDRRRELVLAIERLHPYDEPEVVFVPIVDGRKSYLDWVRDSVSPLS